MILPLPIGWGEGWGEGELAVVTSYAPWAKAAHNSVAFPPRSGK